MTKTILSLFIFFTLTSNCFSQVAKTILLTNNSSRVDSSEIKTQAYLVALALNGPLYTALTHQTKIAELQLKRAKGSWMNLLSISANYNDQTFAKQSPTSTVVFPKYFFGLSIPLGVIFSQGSNIKAAKEEIANSKDQQAQLARIIRADILEKYNQYKLSNQLILLQGELVNDISAKVALAEENFKKGTIAIDIYLTAMKTNNDEISKYLTLKSQQEGLKIEIEKVIGIPLEQAIAAAKIAAPNSSNIK